jgi:hypothetical protein
MSTETKFTPGRWKQAHVTLGSGETDFLVWPATFKTAFDAMRDGSLIASVFAEEDGAASSPTAMANARLIAAAPDMYEALHRIAFAASGGTGPTLTESIAIAKAALAKAVRPRPGKPPSAYRSSSACPATSLASSSEACSLAST